MRCHARVVQDYSDLGESIDIYFSESFRVNFTVILSEVRVRGEGEVSD